MSNIKQQFAKIKSFILDVDGVLTDSMVLTLPDGDQIRRMNIKDGYALKCAINNGFHISIISGGSSESVRKRLNALGIEEVHLSSKNKMEVFENLLERFQLKPENILYMGDDIPDYKVMRKVGIAACPKDAAPEIKNISHFISSFNGGQGAVREVIEQVLKVQDKWFQELER